VKEYTCEREKATADLFLPSFTNRSTDGSIGWRHLQKSSSWHIHYMF